MGHGWASDVAHSNIHERYLFTLLFNLYKNTKVSMDSPLECICAPLQNKDTCPLRKNFIKNMIRYQLHAMNSANFVSNIFFFSTKKYMYNL